MVDAAKSTVDREDIARQIVAVLRTIRDPEIPVNIVDLGLVYELNVDEKGAVNIVMTLTSPGCPVAGMLLIQIQQLVQRVEGVSSIHINLVWDPPWGPEKLSDEARLQLGLM